MLLALLLAAAPPSGAYVQIRNQGHDAGYARVINCSGAGVTCTVDTATNVATFIITGGGDGGTGAGPFCASGYVDTSDGGAFYCVNTITNATQLAANPADCSAGQYATTIAATGDLTCAQVQYSQLGGTPLAGGSVPQMQYNADGGLGGVVDFISDGTNMVCLGATSAPAPPGAGSTLADLMLAAGLPQIPARVDSFGLAMPANMAGGSNAIFAPLGSKWNWLCQCHLMDAWNTNTIPVHVGESTALTLQQSSISTVAWSSASFVGRLRNLTLNSAASNNSSTSYYLNAFTSWRGNTSGAGGFIWMSRFIIQSARDSQNLFAGLLNSISTLSGQPNAQLDAVYIGCNSDAQATESNLSICSNDNSGVASCSDLGGSFPCKTAGAAYDVWFMAGPNASAIWYYIERLDSAASTSGSVSGNLPRNTVQLEWHTSLNNGQDGGTNAVNLGFGGLCGCDNW